LDVTYTYKLLLVCKLCYRGEFSQTKAFCFEFPDLAIFSGSNFNIEKLYLIDIEFAYFNFNR
jgi:hypothetical protein